eukprot:8942334-Pyramimonas_sp.AAC.1
MWINNVSKGQNELDDDNQERFDKLVDRRAWQRRTAQERVLDVKAFVERHRRGPQRFGNDDDPRERLLARWIENVRARG